MKTIVTKKTIHRPNFNLIYTYKTYQDKNGILKTTIQVVVEDIFNFFKPKS